MPGWLAGDSPLPIDSCVTCRERQQHSPLYGTSPDMVHRAHAGRGGAKAAFSLSQWEKFPSSRSTVFASPRYAGFAKLHRCRQSHRYARLALDRPGIQYRTRPPRLEPARSRSPTAASESQRLARNLSAKRAIAATAADRNRRRSQRIAPLRTFFDFPRATPRQPARGRRSTRTGHQLRIDVARACSDGQHIVRSPPCASSRRISRGEAVSGTRACLSPPSYAYRWRLGPAIHSRQHAVRLGRPG